MVIMPYPPRKSRPVRNVTRWIEQGTEWVLTQKKKEIEPGWDTRFAHPNHPFASLR
ncbi:hypothetical protein [Tengunoibacter tsumagoiensis]|uniref:hypothetical protein n=1 Tax=Tengunoibacter tsumagoiensis TaxID=2014871 RepID=UPI001386D409|nr:hypothetical protein [Tengunoibacter tsumagoiensis]